MRLYILFWINCLFHKKVYSFSFNLLIFVFKVMSKKVIPVQWNNFTLFLDVFSKLLYIK